jgi:uncharacterized protein
MKRAFMAIAVLVLAVLASGAQPPENSLLWEISGNGLESPSYLYGTFHLLCPDDLVIPEKALTALQESEQLVLELDFDDPSMMVSMQQGMFMQDGKTAKDYLSAEEYDLVSGFFSSKMGIPFEQISGIKPFFLSAMTLVFFLDCQPTSPEQRLTQLAAGQGKEVLGLETVEDQIGFIDNVPLEDAAEMLVSGIEESEDGDEMIDQMLSAYLEGDLDAIQGIIDSYMGDEYAELNEELIISRNRDWVPSIEKLITDKSSFIAVGAGHLPGENGVIELLRAEGYTVKAVR